MTILECGSNYLPITEAQSFLIDRVLEIQFKDYFPHCNSSVGNYYCIGR